MRKIACSLIIAASLTPLAGCKGINLSSEDKKNGEMTACYVSDVLIAQLRAGGAASKTAAGIIKHNTKNANIKAAATAVERGESVSENRSILLNYVRRNCHK